VGVNWKASNDECLSLISFHFLCGFVNICGLFINLYFEVNVWFILSSVGQN
jgi:hypothetical protein